MPKESNQITKRQALPDRYAAFLQELKQRIRESQVRASTSVNRELILLYWRIGRDILVRQERENWGAKVVDRLAADLKKAFPEMKGFSPRNLKYMRAFAEAWPDEAFVQQAVAQIPWGHNVRILDHVKDPRNREWYVRATLQHSWSRDVLVHQIESGLHKRAGVAVTNFERTLPPPQSDLAQQITKDPYTFDFLMLAHLRDFLLELGVLRALDQDRAHVSVPTFCNAQFWIAIAGLMAFRSQAKVTTDVTTVFQTFFIAKREYECNCGQRSHPGDAEQRSRLGVLCASQFFNFLIKLGDLLRQRTNLL
jgi:predicted nuclease of restriction endonuclease-like (RecB) superfamily